jgi:hypothetical protein
MHSRSDYYNWREKGIKPLAVGQRIRKFRRHPRPPVEPGWGDRFGMWLAKRWKITPRSYRKWKVRWGLSDACNCVERKQKLNRIGRTVSRFRKKWLGVKPKKENDTAL